MNKILPSATALDVSVCNTLQPPAAGVSAGGGIHIQIPPDWQARVMLGQEVPGCTYAHAEPDGSMVVTDAVQVSLAVPALVAGINAAEVSSLTARLATAVAAPSVVAAAVDLESHPAVE